MVMLIQAQRDKGNGTHKQAEEDYRIAIDFAETIVSGCPPQKTMCETNIEQCRLSEYHARRTEESLPGDSCYNPSGLKGHSTHTTSTPAMDRHVFVSERALLEELLLFCYLRQLSHGYMNSNGINYVESGITYGTGPYARKLACDGCILVAMKRLICTGEHYRIGITLQLLLNYAKDYQSHTGCTHFHRKDEGDENKVHSPVDGASSNNFSDLEEYWDCSCHKSELSDSLSKKIGSTERNFITVSSLLVLVGFARGCVPKVLRFIDDHRGRSNASNTSGIMRLVLIIPSLPTHGSFLQI